MMKFFLIVSVSVFLASSLFADSIILRGSIEPTECEVMSGGLDGLHVSFSLESSTSSLLPWSEVAQIFTDSPRPTLHKYLKLGDRIWRAKIRLMRGDLQLSEPALALLFLELKEANGPDARLVSEGLLRCYVAKGQLKDALHPWLETVRLDELGVGTPYTDLQPVLDAETKLCMNLPPIWELDAHSRKVLKKYSKSKLKVVSSLAKMLLIQGNSDELFSTKGVVDSEFLKQVIGASMGDQAMQSALMSYKEEIPAWKQAWRNYFLAAGLLKEQKEESRTTALLLLAVVSAEHQQTSPWLSGASMLLLANELENDGFLDEAIRIRQEMYRTFPTHPLVQTEISN